MAKNKPDKKAKQAEENIREALSVIRQHPIFQPLARRVHIVMKHRNLCPDDGWAKCYSDGFIYIQPKRLAPPEEWVFVLAHCLLHFGFEHHKRDLNSLEWNTACDYMVNRFLLEMKIGCPPRGLSVLPESTLTDEEKLFQYFKRKGIPPGFVDLGTADSGTLDIKILKDAGIEEFTEPTDWRGLLSRGMTQAVRNVAGGLESYLGANTKEKSLAQQAKDLVYKQLSLAWSAGCQF